MQRSQCEQGILLWVSAVLRGHKLWFLLNTLLSCLTVAFRFVFVWLTKAAIDTATDGGSHAQLTRLCVLLVSTVALQAACGLAYKRSRTLLEFHLRHRLQQNCLLQIMRMEWVRVCTYHSGDILKRVESDTASISRFLVFTLPTTCASILQLAGAFVFLFFLDVDVALVLLLLPLMGISAGRLHFRRLRGYSARIKEKSSRLQAVFQESIRNMAFIRSLPDNEWVRSYADSVTDSIEGDVRRRLRYMLVSSSLTNVCFVIAFLFVFVYGIFMLGSGAISYGTLVAFVQLVAQVQSPARTLVRWVADYAGFHTSCGRLRELGRDSEGEVRMERYDMPSPSIKVCGLTFGYKGQGSTVFEDLNYEFRAGTFTAVIGSSGCGKTTLLHLLLAYIKPNRGMLLACIDGMSVPLGKGTRSLFAYLPQGNSLFSTTLRDNLKLANASATDDFMLCALKLACVDFLDTSDPAVLNTVICEDGNGFSRGQVQRLCIARTLLSPAPVLLFDEAASALDDKTEGRIVANMRNALKGKTIIYVTHGVVALSYADKVINLLQKVH